MQFLVHRPVHARHRVGGEHEGSRGATEAHRQSRDPHAGYHEQPVGDCVRLRQVLARGRARRGRSRKPRDDSAPAPARNFEDPGDAAERLAGEDATEEQVNTMREQLRRENPSQRTRSVAITASVSQLESDPLPVVTVTMGWASPDQQLAPLEQSPFPHPAQIGHPAGGQPRSTIASGARRARSPPRDLAPTARPRAETTRARDRRRPAGARPVRSHTAATAAAAAGPGDRSARRGPRRGASTR